MSEILRDSCESTCSNRRGGAACVIAAGMRDGVVGYGMLQSIQT